MLMNEKMYQRVAALVAERLRRKEALASSSQAQTKRDQQSLATEVGDIVDMVAERLSPAFDSPNISRSSSSASFSRTSSTASLGDGESQIQIDEEDDDGVYDDEDTESADSNDDEDDDEGAGYDGIKHKRGKKSVYTCQDRTDVTAPASSDFP